MSGCVSNNDLQTNSITVGQFQENVPANTHITASELMKKIWLLLKNDIFPQSLMCSGV